jgi:hypothetical protein
MTTKYAAVADARKLADKQLSTLREALERRGGDGKFDKRPTNRGKAVRK